MKIKVKDKDDFIAFLLSHVTLGPSDFSKLKKNVIINEYFNEYKFDEEYYKKLYDILDWLYLESNFGGVVFENTCNFIYIKLENDEEEPKHLVDRFYKAYTSNNKDYIEEFDSYINSNFGFC